MGKKKKAPPPPGPHPALAGGLWLLAVAAPAAYCESLVLEFTLAKLLALAVCVPVSAMGLALSLHRGLPMVRRTPLDFHLLAVAAALVLSTWTSQDPRLSLWGGYNSYAYGLWACALYAAFYYLASWGLGEPLRKRTLWTAVGTGAALSAYAVFQSASAAGASELRASATAGSPVHLGAYLALLLPLALHLASGPPEERPAGTVCVLALAAGLWASISRGAWLSAAVGCVLYLVLARPAWLAGWDRRRWSAAGVAALLLTGGLAHRVAQRPVTSADEMRTAAWTTAVRVFRESPLLGSGPDTFKQVFRRLKRDSFIRFSGPMHTHAYAHNDLLQASATTGLAGLAAYLALIGGVLLAARRALADPARTRESAALCGALLSLFVGLKFNPAPQFVLALAAILTGLLVSPREAEGPPDAWSWTAAALLCILGAGSSFAALKLAAADFQVRQASAAMQAGSREGFLLRLDKALALNPCEVHYRVHLYNALLAQATRYPEDDKRARPLLEKAEASGREAVRCHPREMQARFILGHTLLVRARRGETEKLAEAEAELDAGLALDPAMTRLVEFRLEAARLRGDEGLAARLRARLEVLRGLSARS